MPAPNPDETLDVVCTWVDGSLPGHAELRRRYARRPVDLNPNRTRDNLSLLKYGLRSLEQNGPPLGRVFLVTMRPQVPAWLDLRAQGLRVVHHDEIFDPGDLPTFNSFAIVSNLHRVPGVGGRFLYVEDDLLFGRPFGWGDLVDDKGRARVHPGLRSTPPGARAGQPGAGPWDEALAVSNALLDRSYGRTPRPTVGHVPLLVDTAAWASMETRWPGPFRRTRASRFRHPGNVAPEHLYPWMQVHESRAVLVPRLASLRASGYLGLGNREWVQAAGLALLRRWRPTFFCLNDGFGETPNPRVVARVARFLDDLFPHPSRFERSPPA